MKRYKVIVEVEVEVMAKNPKAVDRILDASTFRVERKGKEAGAVHVERTLKYSQFHHET